MSQTFPLLILSPTKVVFQGQVQSCRIETPTGSRGFEAHHENWLTPLAPHSTIEISPPTKEGLIKVNHGTFVFRNNQCTITLEER